LISARLRNPATDDKTFIALAKTLERVHKFKRKPRRKTSPDEALHELVRKIESKRSKGEIQ
jgi:hypothetical protein